MLLRRTEEAAKYLEVFSVLRFLNKTISNNVSTQATKLQTSNGYKEEFTVAEDLMGLAIGKF